MLTALLMSYGIVFVSELRDVKTLSTIGTLLVRYSRSAILLGISVAFLLKVLVAVLLGLAGKQLPEEIVAAVSGGTLFLMALLLFLQRSKDEKPQPEAPEKGPRAALLSFAAIFGSEWLDIGQAAVFNLVAVQHQPLIPVWLGGSLALISKGVLGLLIGVSLRNRIPRRVFRYAAISLCLVMGLLTVLRFD